jgi:protein TonB
MAFQALLFCPDDKTARTVTQVLNELEFEVDPCIEPFAAVKKLMSGHFDALVVDCDNEQNATLLFKSARNSTSNQTSLAVAIVEGQAGVAKAFRIGANLVLTKPINVEQSKGTLRVARGLLRKGEPLKPGTPAAQSASASAPPAPVAAAPFASIPAAPPKSATPKSIPPKPVPSAKPAAALEPKPATAAPTIAPPRRPVQPAPVQPAMQSPQTVAAAQVAASSGLEEADQISAGNEANAPRNLPPAAPAIAIPKTTMPSPAAKAPAASPSGSFSGAASAPAPARETQVQPAEVPAAPQAASLEMPAAPVESAATSATESTSAPAPSFTFGGANADPEADGGRNKIFIAIAAVVLVAVLGYAAYSHFSGGAKSSPPQASATLPATPAASPNPSPVPMQPAPTKPAAAAPVEQTATPSSDLNSSAATRTDEDASTAEPAPSGSHTAAKSSSSAAPAGKPAAATSKPTDPESAPLLVKGGAVPHKKQDSASVDTAAPSLDAIGATGSAGALSGLVGNGTTAPKPVLQALNVSQGVSQGLVIRRVQPVYPRTALVMRIEGSVDLTATISKSGDITNVKVLKGDSQLSKAASDAVKQWKYKPYLLNGEPVEITTQITINFKLPN